MSKFLCKTCKNTNSLLLYDFGQMPAVNNFIDKNNVDKELKFPMELHVCKNCWLIQLSSVPHTTLGLITTVFLKFSSAFISPWYLDFW